MISSFPHSSWLCLIVTQLWQITVLAMVVGIVCRLTCRNRPFLAHGLWLLVIVKCLTPPVLVSFSGVFCWLPMPGLAQVSGRRSVGPELTGTQFEWRDFESSRRHDGFFVRYGDSEPYEGMLIQPTVPFDSSAMHAATSADRAASDVSINQLSRYSIWIAVALACWGIGTLGCLSWVIVRTGFTLRRIRARVTPVPPEIESCFRSVCKRLRIRQGVKLVLTTEPISPVVFGFWTPRLFISTGLLIDGNRARWESIFAHELIHVRRCDIWWCWVAFLGRAIWWFHPLVHAAARRWNLEAERCCDEVVIAELRCSPATYAHHLLDVVQWKQELKSLAPLPGIRKQDVTRKRLERIMKLRQGSRNRMQWWGWLVLLMVACVVLPGGAMTWASQSHEEIKQDEEVVRPPSSGISPSDQAKLANLRNLQLRRQRGISRSQVIQKQETLPANTREWSAQEIEIIEDAIVTGRLDIGPAIARIEKTENCSHDDAFARVKVLLDGLLESQLAQFNSEWDGEQLTVVAAKQKVADLERTIQRIAEFGMATYVIEIMEYRADKKDVSDLTRGWSFVPSALPESWNAVGNSAMRDLANMDGERHAEAVFSDFDRDTPTPLRLAGSSVQTVVSRTVPLRQLHVDDTEYQPLLDVMAERKIELTSFPKLMVFSGQPATILSGSRRPFVTSLIPTESESGKKVYQPVITVLESGTAVHVRPIETGDGHVHLDARLVFSHIGDVEELTFDSEVVLDDLGNNVGNAGTTVQVPVFTSTKVSISTEVPINGAYAVAGMESPDEDDDRRIVIVIRVRPGADLDSIQRAAEAQNATKAPTQVR